jgi:hypothetical protein
MASEAAIREQLVNYLAGESSLDSLDEWLTAETWNIHQTASSGQRLAYAVELRLSEHSAGHLSDAQLDDEFKALLGSFAASVNVGAAPPPVIEKSASTTAPQPVAA